MMLLVILVTGVYPRILLERIDLSMGLSSLSGISSYFLFGCNMLININQNKKNSGKRISYNKRKKFITKYNNGTKNHQYFYTNYVFNTKKKHEEFDCSLSCTKSKSSFIPITVLNLSLNTIGK